MGTIERELAAALGVQFLRIPSAGGAHPLTRGATYRRLRRTIAHRTRYAAVHTPKLRTLELCGDFEQSTVTLLCQRIVALWDTGTTRWCEPVLVSQAWVR